MTTKIVKLTPANVKALELMAPGHTSLLETTKTTALFVGLTAYEALGVVQRMRETAGERYGRKGGAYQSLHAVVRKLLALAEEEQAAAKVRSEARAEQDAANDPLVKLLDIPVGTPDPVTGLTVGASIRPKAWVTAHVAEEPPAERKFRTRPGSRVAGRLLATSKCRRNRRR